MGLIMNTTCCIAYSESEYTTMAIQLMSSPLSLQHYRHLILVRKYLLYENKMVLDEWTKMLVFISHTPRPTPGSVSINDIDWSRHNWVDMKEYEDIHINEDSSKYCSRNNSVCDSNNDDTTHTYTNTKDTNRDIMKNNIQRLRDYNPLWLPEELQSVRLTYAIPPIYLDDIQFVLQLAQSSNETERADINKEEEERSRRSSSRVHTSISRILERSVHADNNNMLNNTIYDLFLVVPSYILDSFDKIELLHAADTSYSDNNNHQLHDTHPSSTATTANISESEPVFTAKYYDILLNHTATITIYTNSTTRSNTRESWQTQCLRSCRDQQVMNKLKILNICASAGKSVERPNKPVWNT